MADVMVGNLLGIVDKRWNGKGDSILAVGKTIFTANDAGTTTTIVGADATLATGVNVVRVGEKGKLFNSSAALKEETTFTVTGVATAGSVTTVTFTPAAAGATASGDTFRKVGYEDADDLASLDTRLNAIDGTAYSAKHLRIMSLNDKRYALRVHDDTGSL